MSTASTMLVNGEACGVVPVTDRGLMYGDGVFETMAVEAGRLRYWRRHIARLQSGCDRLGIPAPAASQLEEEALRLVDGVAQGVLKLIITRGQGGRGYAAPPVVEATRVLQLHPWPDYPGACREQGVKTRLCTTRLARNPVLAGIKHLNRLEQVLARAEWSAAEIREGLMMDSDDNLVEATMSNLFLVKDGALLTPDLSHCGVAGVMRTIIIEQAGALGLDCRVSTVSREMLQRADEIFLCNSLLGIWPVIAIDANHYRVGELTRRLQTSVSDHHDDSAGWLV